MHFLIFFIAFQDKGIGIGRIIAIESRRKDLYSLDLLYSTALCARSSLKASEEILHARLGHPQSKILKSSKIA